MEASMTSMETSKPLTNASMEAVETSVEAFTLPWKRPASIAVEASVEVSIEISTEVPMVAFWRVRTEPCPGYLPRALPYKELP